jgi:hypothetical protein
MRESYNLQRPARLPPAAGTRLLVKISARASGNGIYTGKIQRPPTADIDATANLSASMIGVDGPSCIVVNTQEVGAASNFLSVGEVYHGRIVRMNANGNAVVAVDGCLCGCFRCTGGPTPATWTLTGSGITQCSPFLNCGVCPAGGVPSFNGTFTLTQQGGKTGCSWLYSQALNYDLRAACDCFLDSTPGAYSQNWLLDRSNPVFDGYQLTGWIVYNPTGGIPGTAFSATPLATLDTNCPESTLTFTNTVVCDPFSQLELCSGGTAVLTHP